MKYPRGSYLQWTPKALKLSRERHLEDRMIVLSHDEVAMVHKGVVEQLDMYKTQDCYVKLATEPCPKGLRVDRLELVRCNAECLVKEFGFKITKNYQGRKY
jgi:hypothetical protein